MKRLRIAALLLLLILISACSKPAATEPTGPALTWTGSALEGAPFYRRTLDHVTVHYTAPTLPDQAETLAKAADLFLRTQNRDRWFAPDERLHLWVLPARAPMPQGLNLLPGERRIQAVTHGTIVVDELVIGNPTVGQQEGLQPRDLYRSLSTYGLPQAIAVATTQPTESPAYEVPWLHDGLGMILTGEFGDFPSRLWQQAYYGNGGKPPLLMQRLATIETSLDWDYLQAAGSLAALAMDRWGVRWPMAWAGRAEEATPEAILLWATGQSDREAALGLFQRRMMAIGQWQIGNGFNTLVEMSPIRVEGLLPELPKGPGPNENYSPHAYDIAASYDPGTRTVTGTEKLTWINGEGIPVETLYFNLWPNDEMFARQDGAMSIKSVTVDGQAVPYRAEGLDLVVPLGRAMAPGETAKLEIAFETRVPTAARRPFLQSPDGLFYLSYWYPTLSVLDDRGWNLTHFPQTEPYTESAAYHVALEVPAGTVLGATGRQLERREQGERWTYVYEAAQAKGWVAAGGTALVEEVRQVGPVTVRVLEPSGTWGKKVADLTEQTLELFVQRFGPYPGEELVVMPTYGAVKAPGMVFISSSQEENVFRPALYHGIAHQWFYGSVGSDPIYEGWLDEALAAYGEQAAGLAFGGLRPTERRMTGPTSSVIITHATEEQLYGPVVTAEQVRGDVVLRFLTRNLGEHEVDRLLREFATTYRHKTATTADFIRIASAAFGRDLETVFTGANIQAAARRPYAPAWPLGMAPNPSR